MPRLLLTHAQPGQEIELRFAPTARAARIAVFEIVEDENGVVTIRAKLTRDIKLEVQACPVSA
jgi:hypothetical protein